MSGCRPIDTSNDLNVKFKEDKEGKPVDVSRYLKLVGKLIYLSQTRPNIAFAINLVS